MFRFTNRLILLFLLSSTALLSHSQLLLVVAPDMNTTEAKLQRYVRAGTQWERVGSAIPVNLGRNGMGWGIGAVLLPHSASDPVKREGDGRAPAGIFTLGPAFGYDTAEQTSMPYLPASPDLICVDDDRSADYNRIVRVSGTLQTRSFEWMRRPDGLYRVGIVVHHNAEALTGAGSCIFLHIERAPGAGTAGCTSMPENALETLLRWLDPAQEPLLVQIPSKSLDRVGKMFEGVRR